MCTAVDADDVHIDINGKAFGLVLALRSAYPFIGHNRREKTENEIIFL